MDLHTDTCLYFHYWLVNALEPDLNNSTLNSLYFFLFVRSVPKWSYCWHCRRKDKRIPFCNFLQAVWVTNVSLCINLASIGDLKADRYGAKLPAWLDRQSAFIFQKRFRAWWQTKLHSESDVCREPVQCFLHIHSGVVDHLSKNITTSAR